MDPIQRAWMYENWLADQNEQAELAKNHAYLLASFWNPEAVKKILGGDANTHSSTDEEFEESVNLIQKINEAKQPVVRKRKRKTITKG